ncbi:MAG: TolC family protein [Bacteroidota bacterium]
MYTSIFPPSFSSWKGPKGYSYRPHKGVALLIGLFVCIWTSAGQTPLSLPDAVTIALANNPELAVLGYDKQISENNIDPALVGLQPRIDIQSQLLLGYGDTRTETVNLGPPGSENPPIELNGLRRGIIIQPEASWLVLDGGQAKARLEQLRLVDQATADRLTLARDETTVAVIRTYLAASSLADQLQLASDNIDLSNDRLSRIERAGEYGTANSLARLQSQVDLRTDSVAFQQLNLQLANIKRDLNFLLGRDPETEFSLVPLSSSMEVLSYNDLEADLRKSNSGLAAARTRILLQENELDQALRAGRPVLSLYANANYLNQQDDANFLLENRNFGAEAGLRFSYNIFDAGARQTQQQNARIQVAQAAKRYEQTELQLVTRLRQAYASYENSLFLLETERRNLPTFQLNFDKTQEDYRLGQVDATQLRNAQVNLNAAKTRISLLELEVRTAITELMLLAGRING